MKFELSFLHRAYHANLLRIRAENLTTLADDRSLSATKSELIDEAKWCRDQARRLDDAEEAPVVSDKEPSRVNAACDIIQGVEESRP